MSARPGAADRDGPAYPRASIASATATARSSDIPTSGPMRRAAVAGRETRAARVRAATSTPAASRSSAGSICVVSDAIIADRGATRATARSSRSESASRTNAPTASAVAAMRRPAAAP